MNRPIEGVSTNIAAFVGLAEGGPLEEPTTIDGFDGWGTDEDAIWESIHARPLGSALQSFFENGGVTAIAVGVEDAGTTAVRAGLAALDEVDLVNLVVLPAETADREDARDTVAEAAAWCERRRAMLLVDPPPGWTDVAAIEAALAEGLESAVGTASANAALYLPRLRRTDPAQGAAAKAVSPTGAVAGIIARTDAAEGVWSAPAGLDAEIRGADGLEFALDQHDAESLNSAGISTLRMFPGRGPVVWGARTLAGADTRRASGSTCRCVALRSSSRRASSGACDGRGSSRTTNRCGSRCARTSARSCTSCSGRAPSRGAPTARRIFVRCDRDTMTQHERDAGDLVVLVGFAPMKPAEFVVLTIRVTALPSD